MLLNIAAYHFVDDPQPAGPPTGSDTQPSAFADPQKLDALRETLRARGRELALRGTILLAPEGINLVACGDAEPPSAP